MILPRDAKVSVSTTVAVVVTRDMTVTEFLGLGVTDPMPEVGSDEWNNRAAWWSTDEALALEGIKVDGGHIIDMDVSVTYQNPAHDADAIPMFPDHAPDEYVTIEVGV